MNTDDLRQHIQELRERAEQLPAGDERDELENHIGALEADLAESEAEDRLSPDPGVYLLSEIGQPTRVLSEADVRALEDA